MTFGNFFLRLAPWNVAIFVATLTGCYVPQVIVTGNHGLRAEQKVCSPQHTQQHETLMSYMMALSAGVCFGVAILFQIAGYSIFTEAAKDAPRGCMKAGILFTATFLLFFSVEQLATICQTWHARNCAGMAPCAVEVANQPLEAASVVRTIAEHSNVRLEDMRCSSLSQETMNKGEPIEHFSECWSAPLLDTTSRVTTPPRYLRQCPVCCRKGTLPVVIEKRTKSYLVLSFLLVLFTIHSLAEGLGLGASACSIQPTQITRTATIAVAILLHKSLSAFAVGAALLKEGMSSAVMGIISLGFSLMSPLGSILGYASCQSLNSERGDISQSTANGYFMVVASGTFLFISLIEFVPTSFQEGSKGPGSINTRVVKTLLFLTGSMAVIGAECGA